jgi:hypothetical protein
MPHPRVEFKGVHSPRLENKVKTEFEPSKKNSPDRIVSSTTRLLETIHRRIVFYLTSNFLAPNHHHLH